MKYQRIWLYHLQDALQVEEVKPAVSEQMCLLKVIYFYIL